MSRWLWLVKWLLVIPHLIVLAFLWIAFVAVSVVAFFAILFTGRYPRDMFEFNVGVLRWTWRVGFYAYNANGTDRYPPFTLDAADYPATLEIAYPERLSHWLVLVKWLLVIPQLVIVAIFMGGFGVAGWHVGLIGLLVLFGVVALAFRGEYPRSIFDLVLGLNRWTLRVVPYAALMTDAYPPFRLDLGESDAAGPAGVVEPPAAAAAAGRSWTAGRVVLLVVSTLAALVALAAVGGGATAIVFDQTQRDHDGYLMTNADTYTTDTYAFVSGTYEGGTAGDVVGLSDFLGKIRLRSESQRRVFLGIARQADVERYLGKVRREQGSSFEVSPSDFDTYPGGKPAAPPTSQRIWAVSKVGSGKQVITWKPKSGKWRIVVMNADGSAGVTSRASIGARFPDLLPIGLGVLAGGGVLLLLSGLGIYAALRRPRTARPA